MNAMLHAGGEGMVRAVLFDMDGVLVDSFEAWVRLMNATALHLGCAPVDREEFRAVYGQPTKEDVRMFFPRHTVTEVEAFYDAHFTDYTQHIEANPDAPGVLAALRRMRVGIGVVTNTPSPLARRVLEGLGLAPDELVGGSDVPAAKPAPDMVLRACGLLGVAPTEALMVGDSAYDRQAAAAAGVRFAGLGIEGDVRLQRLGDVIALVRA